MADLLPVVPPGNSQRYTGMHWLQRHLYGSAGNTDLIALQWNPGSCTWTHCDCHDTTAQPIDTKGWKYIAPIPYPELALLLSQAMD